MRFHLPARAALFGLLGTGALWAAAPLRPDPGAGVAPAAGSTLPAGPPSGLFLAPQQALEHHEFYFTRAVYSDWSSGRFGRRGRGSWATDYPKADQQFMTVVQRLVNIDAYGFENAVRLDDPQLRRFPFIYALEVGRMGLPDEEVEGLRSYLNAGGFLVIDDFWGPGEWDNFVREISRVLPGRPIYELPQDHPVFNNVYDIAEILQVPNVRTGQMHGAYGTPTHEGWGSEVPHVYGIDDDRGELMVIINWNTDLGDAWEWAENPYYPLKFSTFAYEMGVNMIVYAMSH